MGFALSQVQDGDEPVAAKALKGFGGRTVLELVDDFDSDTYRAVYTVRFAGLLSRRRQRRASPRPSETST
jgi:phage-related protein